jgi:signal transduction histidine kinase
MSDKEVTSQLTSPDGAGNRRPWLDRAVIASVRGVALCGPMFTQLAVAVIVLVAVALVPVVVGFYLLPSTLLAARKQAERSRHRIGEWSGVAIPALYRPAPELGEQKASWRQQYPWLLGDPTTWRDLLWLIVNPTFGWLYTLAPTALVLWGLFGVAMPAIWKPIVDAHADNWYAMIHVTSASAAWLSVPLGAAFVLLGLLVGPALLRSYGRFARSMLAPSRQAELSERVRHLSESRADAATSREAEIRRIERDLHDGAQARLVAMGMTLGAAQRLVEHDPSAARVLLSEAVDASAKALGDLRDLVRGIHPPVLADRGLSDAVRALALDSALKVEVVADLPRLDPPIEAAAYFAVCELLTNVAKHAMARKVRIDLRYQAGELHIDVVDDGRGGAEAAKGTGLRGIERRLDVFDGHLAVSSPQGGPTIMSIELPCVLLLPKTSSF